MAVVVVGLPVLRPAVPARETKFADIYTADPDRGAVGAAVGAPVAGTDGDLRGATPTQALRARVTRMLSNPPGAYAHLGDWGARVRRGALARVSELARLQMQTKRFLLEDPDIVDADVSLTIAPRGIRRVLLCDVRVKDRHGTIDNFTTPLGG